MKIPGLRTLGHLLKIRWRDLPLSFVHGFTDFFPSDEVFKSIRSSLLKACGLRIGRGCKFGKDVFVLDYGKLSIGKNTVINHQVYFDSYKEVSIGEGCDIGFRSCFITGNHRLETDFKGDRPLDESRCLPIRIEDFVWIGAGATILPGVTVKRGAVVGACSLVTRDVEENTVVVGVPAKKVKELGVVGSAV